MPKLRVIKYPDSRLRLKAQKVEVFNDEVVELADEMTSLMYAEKGIGLAATQVNVQKSVLIVDVSKKQDQPICLVNPEIVSSEGQEVMEEGCLSVPGIYAEVKRAEKIKIKAFTPTGEPLDMEADGLLAVCIQHEMDHLQGKLFVDYLSPAKRQRVVEELKRQRKSGKVESREKVPYQLV